MDAQKLKNDPQEAWPNPSYVNDLKRLESKLDDPEPGRLQLLNFDL